MIQVCRDGKVWTAADARSLREEHRIVCGTGCICRENSNKSPLCRIPLQLTPEQVYVGRVHGFIATSASSIVEATGPSASPVAVGWWQSVWSAVASFFQSPPPTQSRHLKKRRTDQGDSVDAAPVVDAAAIPLRHRVFLDLWEKGLYITSGSKFGGDFLIYDADPLTTHAKAIVLVAESPIVAAPALAGYCRLARAVKKSWVLAFADVHQTVSYTTLAHVTTVSRVSCEEFVHANRQDHDNHTTLSAPLLMAVLWFAGSTGGFIRFKFCVWDEPSEYVG
ncbi:hypothetical protein H310_04815 [Aphanomyces invadans]|uniref:tRNA-intron lyase n=1 Tax=Aphanomyces invadans TaxID=157072 RepID=A0A024UCF8_9STRA|nr:hypothetical protein H310_04815 [Aphanomyces invadans]ETW03318.1 hypothetical protein H310_04815 [Aphanomyces invadans]|eukprot:XP_008867547.1 hypothetical protein H310_04815 [Aphanomyces invadans]